MTYLIMLVLVLLVSISIIFILYIKTNTKSEQHTQIFLDSAPFAVNIINKNLKNIDVNKEAVRLFEAPSRQYCMDNFDKFSPEYQPDGTPSLEGAIKNVNKTFTEGYLRCEWMHQTASGEPLPCELTLVRVKYKGEFVVAGYARDLRESKARMQAEQSSHYKSAFLANMSHEIRTPMNAILGIAEIQLQKENLPKDSEEAFIKIYESGDLLLRIINDILDLSKIEAGKLEIVAVKYDVPNMISDTVHLNRLRYENKSVLFNLSFDKDIPFELIGDELRLKQILNNILSNAFKYTEKGEINLTVSWEFEHGNEEGTLIFSVSDTGQGMTKDQLNKLFDEYTRFNIEANRTTIGAGLGMSITKKLIQMMGGFINIPINIFV